jgi:catechol 2,3-dioxygenase-like lactoylglutathione lyase family enzyme
MTWSIHHVSLVAHDLDAAAHFFGTLIGLGAARASDAQSRFIGEAGRGLCLHRPAAALARSGAMLLGPVGARYVALEVASLAEVVAKLDQAGLAYAPALPGEGRAQKAIEVRQCHGRALLAPRVNKALTRTQCQRFRTGRPVE